MLFIHGTVPPPLRTLVLARVWCEKWGGIRSNQCFTVSSARVCGQHCHSSFYFQLINDIWSKKRHRCLAPSSVHATLRMTNPTFKGYQQQVRTSACGRHQFDVAHV